MGPSEFGIHMPTCLQFAEEISGAIRQTNVELCLVIGGGNIFRGLAGAANGMDRSQADSMGMLATVMNALAMQSALEQIGTPTRVQSAIPMDTWLSCRRQSVATNLKPRRTPRRRAVTS